MPYSLNTGEQLIDLFSHVPNTEMNFNLLKDNLTVADVALQAAVVPSQCRFPAGS